MAEKKKKHYYVLVTSDEGAIFVTEVKNSTREAYWNYKEKPLEMSQREAEDLCIGLNLNFHSSFVVAQPFEVDKQPYRYDKWKIEWKERENN